MEKSILAIFQVQEKQSRILDLIKSLEENATGYTSGLHIEKVEGIRGMYGLYTHNGENTINSGLVRIVGPQIWAGKTTGYAGMIENLLRSNKIPYELATVEVEKGKASAKQVHPFDLDGIVEVEYTPRGQK